MLDIQSDGRYATAPRLSSAICATFPVRQMGTPRDSEPTTFPARLKALREKRGLTQRQLGEAVGVGESAVNRWENDKGDEDGREPPLARLVLIAKELATSTDWLLGMPDVPEPKAAELSPHAQRVLKRAVTKLRSVAEVVDDLSALAGPGPRRGRKKQ